MSIGASNLWKREKIIRPATGRVSRQNNRQYYHATTPNSIRTRVTPSHIHTSTHIHTYIHAPCHIPKIFRRPKAGAVARPPPDQVDRGQTGDETRHHQVNTTQNLQSGGGHQGATSQSGAEFNQGPGGHDRTGHRVERSETGQSSTTAWQRWCNTCGHADTLAQHTAAAAAADTRGDTSEDTCDATRITGWHTLARWPLENTHTLTHFHTAAAVAATATGQRSSVRPPAEGENLFLKAVLKKTMDDNIRIYFSQP